MALLAHRPRMTATAAADLARRSYGVRGSATPLPSERDQNFLLETVDGERFVLKIANAREDHALLLAQAEVLRRLSDAGAACPRLLPTLDGELLAVTAPAPVANFVRLVSYVPGTLLSELRDRPDALFVDLGRQLATIDRALYGVDLPALHRSFHWDLARGVAAVHERIGLVRDRLLRALVERLVGEIDAVVLPLAAHLRRGVIHNDANDHNVVVAASEFRTRHRRVAAVIDYGDLVHSWIVGEPAVAAAYAMLDHPDPLAVAAAIAAGYHEGYALGAPEFAVLFPLALLRLCMSVCIAADQQAQAPADAYLGVSQAPIARTLPRLAEIPSAFAEARLRAACGLRAVPASDRVVTWLGAHAGTAAPVLALDPQREPAAVLDLGIESPLVSGEPADNGEPMLTGRIEQWLREAGAVVGIGRYDEARLLYTSPIFAPRPMPGAPDRPVTAAPVHPALAEHRTVHLGVDLFAPAGTPVQAPLDGEVYACTCNDAPLDYGGVVILRHLAGGEPFFALYGHLAPASIAGLREGMRLARGEAFATLGMPAENGGWPPHLHLQLFVDLLAMGTDAPGVCRASERDAWKGFSPDPNLLLRIPALSAVAPGPGKAALLAARRASLGPSLRLSYDEPLLIVRGWMQYLFDETGRRYLDAYNNVPHVGHAHPIVVAAGRRQMALLNTNTRYLHPLVVRLAERLTATTPEPLDVCFFVNSASEANELALRLARAHSPAGRCRRR